MDDKKGAAFPMGGRWRFAPKLDGYSSAILSAIRSTIASVVFGLKKTAFQAGISKPFGQKPKLVVKPSRASMAGSIILSRLSNSWRISGR